jgi:type IX secretion system substrate protein
VTVEYSAGKGQTLQLFNYAGTEVFRLPLAEGFNRIELNVQNLPAGLYVCKIVQGPGQILSKKVVVLK